MVWRDWLQAPPPYGLPTIRRELAWRAGKDGTQYHQIQSGLARSTIGLSASSCCTHVGKAQGVTSAQIRKPRSECFVCVLFGSSLASAAGMVRSRSSKKLPPLTKYSRFHLSRFGSRRGTRVGIRVAYFNGLSGGRNPLLEIRSRRLESRERTQCSAHHSKTFPNRSAIPNTFVLRPTLSIGAGHAALWCTTFVPMNIGSPRSLPELLLAA